MSHAARTEFSRSLVRSRARNRRWGEIGNSGAKLSSSRMRCVRNVDANCVYIEPERPRASKSSNRSTRSFATSPDTTCFGVCFSVQQGTVRDSGVQIPWEARRLRVGRDTGHPDPLHETAETAVCRLRELHSKVGSHQYDHSSFTSIRMKNCPHGVSSTSALFLCRMLAHARKLPTESLRLR